MYQAGAPEGLGTCKVAVSVLGGIRQLRIHRGPIRPGFPQIAEPHYVITLRETQCDHATSLSRSNPLTADPGVITVPHQTAGKGSRGGGGLMAASVRTLARGDASTGGPARLAFRYRHGIAGTSRRGQDR